MFTCGQSAVENWENGFMYSMVRLFRIWSDVCDVHRCPGSIHTQHARRSSTKTQCSYRLMRGPPTHNQGLTSAYVLSHNIPHTYYLYSIPHTYFWVLAATHHDAAAAQHMLQEFYTRDGVYCFAGSFCLCLVHRLQAAIGAEDIGRGLANYRRCLPRWC